MIGTLPDERALNVALLSIFPRVQPSQPFLINMYADFDESLGPDHQKQDWYDQLREWMAKNVGLIVEDQEGSWTNYRIVDQGKYAFALLKYA